jgi:hypothetical protein
MAIEWLPKSGDEENLEAQRPVEFTRVWGYGCQLTPLLLSLLEDTTLTQYSYYVSDVRVGDVAAFFLWHRCEGCVLRALPKKIVAQYKEVGVSAYVSWVKKGNHRKQFAVSLRKIVGKSECRENKVEPTK